MVAYVISKASMHNQPFTPPSKTCFVVTVSTILKNNAVTLMLQTDQCSFHSEFSDLSGHLQGAHDSILVVTLELQH